MREKDNFLLNCWNVYNHGALFWAESGEKTELLEQDVTNRAALRNSSQAEVTYSTVCNVNKEKRRSYFEKKKWQKYSLLSQRQSALWPGCAPSAVDSVYKSNPACAQVIPGPCSTMEGRRGTHDGSTDVTPFKMVLLQVPPSPTEPKKARFPTVQWSDHRSDIVTWWLYSLSVFLNYRHCNNFRSHFRHRTDKMCRQINICRILKVFSIRINHKWFGLVTTLPSALISTRKHLKCVY